MSLQNSAEKPTATAPRFPPARKKDVQEHFGTRYRLCQFSGVPCLHGYGLLVAPVVEGKAPKLQGFYASPHAALADLLDHMAKERKQAGRWLKAQCPGATKDPRVKAHMDFYGITELVHINEKLWANYPFNATATFTQNPFYTPDEVQKTHPEVYRWRLGLDGKLVEPFVKQTSAPAPKKVSVKKPKTKAEKRPRMKRSHAATSPEQLAAEVGILPPPPKHPRVNPADLKTKLEQMHKKQQAQARKKRTAKEIKLDELRDMQATENYSQGDGDWNDPDADDEMADYDAVAEEGEI